MSGWFKAIAVDFDGTLAEGDRPPDDDVLAAVGESRRAGRRVVLVTGRILEELRAVFPAVDDWFDAIVAENGAVLAVEGSARILAAPVEMELDGALVARGVPFRRGQVLLATRADHEVEIGEELRRLGLEAQLTRNRGELMVLPPGVTKGSGTDRALEELGLSHHSAVGIGDGENDHSLLRTCELGVAVANAVPSLKRQADLVLEKPHGPAVAELLRGPLISGERTIESRRWQVELGRTAAGASVRIPASQVNVLVVGRSGSGKSYLAGLLAEQWIGLGYSLCIVDPEGDFAPLGALPGTLALGGHDPLPRPHEVQRFIERRFGSVLLDLSLTDRASREQYVPPLLAQLEAERAATGLPHWILLDEAHHLRPPDDTLPSRGHCLVTYRPHALSPGVCDAIDVILALPGGKAPAEGERDPFEALEEIWGLDFASWRHAQDDQVLLARPRLGHGLLAFRPHPRRMPHVRHWHKYFGGRLPASLHFTFRTEGGAPRHVASNVREFHRGLLACDGSVLRHHVGRGDFSRWLGHAIQDVGLARGVRELERGWIERGRREDELETLRLAVVHAVEARYMDEAMPDPASHA